MAGLTFAEAEAVMIEAMKYRNYTESSIESYRTHLKMFDRYLRHKETRLKIRDYRDVKEADYYGFLEFAERRSKRGIKRETLGKYGVNLKGIFALLEQEEKILQNPFAGIETMKNIRRIREMTLTEEEMERFLSCVERGAPHEQAVSVRNRVILETFYGTGIRARELMKLDVTDFLKEEKMLFIRNGKGQKDRVVPLGPNVSEYLKRYLSKVRPRLVRRKKLRERALFLGKFGERLGPRILMRLFEYARKKSGIKKHVTPHVMRHSFATHLINAGADIREVQLLLGHSRISSTEIYVNLATSRLKEVYEKYHPLENELFFDVKERESYIFDWKEEKR
jgi:site-specific recombinase XerD